MRAEIPSRLLFATFAFRLSPLTGLLNCSSSNSCPQNRDFSSLKAPSVTAAASSCVNFDYRERFSSLVRFVCSLSSLNDFGTIDGSMYVFLSGLPSIASCDWRVIWISLWIEWVPFIRDSHRFTLFFFRCWIPLLASEISDLSRPIVRVFFQWRCFRLFLVLSICFQRCLLRDYVSSDYTRAEWEMTEDLATERSIGEVFGKRMTVSFVVLFNE